MGAPPIDRYKEELGFEQIQWDFDPETHVGNITIDRPPHNTLSEKTTEELIAGLKAFNFLDHEQSEIVVRAVVIEGAGDKAFSTGGDLKDIDKEEQEETIQHDYDNVVLDYTTRPFGGDMTGPIFLDQFERFPAPIIAKIDGYCLGGGLELSLACDFRIGSYGSKLGLPESNLGLFPSSGATQRLTELVGPSKAKDMIMTGKHITAEEAYDNGILNYVYEEDEFDEQVAEFAETLAGRPPLSMRSIKHVIDLHDDVGRTVGIRLANREWVRLHETEDYEEGLTSFIEDREPEWTGVGSSWKG